MSDHDSMIAVRDGNIDKMGLLFDGHHRRLFNFFLLATGNRPVSEDLVQDVFFRMLKYRHTYRDDGDFETWMFRIARNARVDYYRARRQQDPIEDHAELASKDPDPSETCEQRERADLVRQALARLPEEKREVILMSKFSNMKYEDIGAVLGCTVGAVKVRVHRALRELADVYSNLTGEVRHGM